MNNVINIDKQIEEATKNLPDDNYMLGRTLLQPFKPANSGSRALMASVHVEHLLVPTNGEVPIIQTGFETEFGKHSTSFVTAKSDYDVICKISKFDFTNQHYYIIVRDRNTGLYDVIERTPCNHNTESYGFLWKNDYLDSIKDGDVIHSGDVIKTSNGFDKYGNKMNGVNLITAYLSLGQNMEDSIILSKSAAKKFETSLIKSASITINDNDVLLNLYGNDTDVYKTFPHVGEQIQNGLFCAIRRFENDNVLYSLSQARLREPNLSDRSIILNGTVADINVYCNNPKALGDSYYNQQLLFYYEQNKKFCNRIVEVVAPLAMKSQLSYNLQKLYAICRDTIAGKQFFKDKQFSNVIMEVTVIEPLPTNTGDKMCDRYGGKGIISEIRDDELMPTLDNGKRVEVIKNSSTCINRENIGQLHEQSLTFIGMRLLDCFNFNTFTYREMCEILYKFISMVDKDQANELMSWIDYYDEEQCKCFVDSIMEDGGVILSTPPFTTPINISTIKKIYDEFPFIKQYKVYVPMEDSNGNIRKVETRRPMAIGYIYNYRLKQYAKEKFSVNSMGAINLKGLNTRSKANKIYEAKYTKTPIMFGNMETADMLHMGIEVVVTNLLLYSTSTQARRLFENLLIGDPYNIDIKIDENSKNRNAEIINALFKTMGVGLVFEKMPKVKKEMAKNVMVKYASNANYSHRTNVCELMDMRRTDKLKMQYENAVYDKSMSGTPMVKKVMVKLRGDNNGT